MDASRIVLGRAIGGYYWPGRYDDIRRYCDGCDICQKICPRLQKTAFIQSRLWLRWKCWELTILVHSIQYIALSRFLQVNRHLPHYPPEGYYEGSTPLLHDIKSWVLYTFHFQTSKYQQSLSFLSFTCPKPPGSFYYRYPDSTTPLRSPCCFFHPEVVNTTFQAW